MLEATKRFTDRAADYARYRPVYPEALFRDLATLLPRDAVVADVGAGTGLFTNPLAAQVGRVYALEPNAAMREAGAAGRVNVEWREATGEATGLEDQSLDGLTCATAFHWLDPARAAQEWRRILRPRAPVILVWNVRDLATPVMQEYEALQSRWCPHFPKLKGDEEQPILAFFAPGPAHHAEYRHVQRLDLEGWQGRLRSSSYTPHEGQPGHRELMEGLGDLFRRHRESDGLLTFPYVTHAYWGRLNDGMGGGTNGHI